MKSLVLVTLAVGELASQISALKADGADIARALTNGRANLRSTADVTRSEKPEDKKEDANVFSAGRSRLKPAGHAPKSSGPGTSTAKEEEITFADLLSTGRAGLKKTGNASKSPQVQSGQQTADAPIGPPAKTYENKVTDLISSGLAGLKKTGNASKSPQVQSGQQTADAPSSTAEKTYSNPVTDLISSGRAGLKKTGNSSIYQSDSGNENAVSEEVSSMFV